MVMRLMSIRMRDALILATLLVPLHSAWALYKIISPSGEVTFTDVPPAIPGQLAQRVDTTAAGDEGPVLPFTLKRLVRERPVLLYTTPHCPACEDGVKLLRTRGVPYTEKTVSDATDLATFRADHPRVDHLPLLSIGGVTLTPGFDPEVWNQALSTAGYPENSALPPHYKFAAPTHLAPPASRPAQKAPTPHHGQDLQPPVLPPSNPNAPPGFQF